MLNKRLLISLLSAIHRILYRASGGLIGGRTGGPVLLLTTVGRKSGRPHTTPLLYLQDKAHWVVVASNAGDDRHPAWWLNLKRNPEATIQIKRRVERVLARKAAPAESTQLWPRFIKMFSGYQDYRSRTQRKIPIVILTAKNSSSRQT